jgi:vancomycin resistance protein YoaR
MGKFVWTISIILAASLVGLLGCSEKTTREKELEKKVADLQQQIDEYNKSKEKEKKKEETIEVHVIAPNTKEVVKTFIPKAMGFETNKEKYKEEIESWAKTVARGTESTAGYDQRMIPDRIGVNGQIIKGRSRVILEESELSEKVLKASEKGGTVELPLYVTESGYKPEDVPHLGEVVVASYTTYFNSSVAGRARNIELSAQALNNVIIGSQDIFSFNTTVGPRDEAHGYQEAVEAVNGKLVMGIGGGICQTSSTLYNAIDKLRVTYIEKHHHSVNVGYVPKGRDATVSYGGLDFRFQNTTGVPLLLKAYVKKGSLTVEVRTSKANQGLIKK